MVKYTLLINQRKNKMEKKMKISGVYSITNNVTGDFYIGSSKDIKQRWTNHRSPSQWKLHPNVKLYQAFIKYGLGNFIFEVLEETADLKEKEQYWIEQLKPTYNDRHADGWNTKRCNEAHKRCSKEWYKAHRNKKLTYNKAYYNRLCLYEGETLTLKALTNRFCYQGIPHSTVEAKKYLIQE